MSVTNTARWAGVQLGRAISILVYVVTFALVVRFFLNQGPDTLAHVLMVAPLALVCLAGSWAYERFLR